MKRNKGLLNEEFNIKTGLMQGNGGKYFPVAYIEGDGDDNTFQHKDKIKKTYGAQWLRNIGDNGAWGWFLPDSEEGKQKVLKAKIRPCLEYLMSVETTPENGIIRDIDSAIAELQSAVFEGPSDVIEKGVLRSATYMSKEEILEKLEEFKRDIVNSINSDELHEKLDQIAKWNNTLAGKRYSGNNRWFAIVQDRDCTDVRPIKEWRSLNREVVPNAILICLARPIGEGLSKEEKRVEREKFLQKVGKKSVRELNYREKLQLNDILNYNDASKGFVYKPNWVDVRFTKQIEGKPVLFTEKPDGLEWFDENATESEKYEMLIEAAFDVARNYYGLDIQIKPESVFGGARGYATSKGEIAFREGYKNNSDMLRTVVHEISHQLLHHKYAHTKNEELKQFYLGRGSRELLEQQADICAYIVLRQLGITETTRLNANYVVGWGTNETNAKLVFDQVANTANNIAQNIIEKFNNEEETQESNETEVNV